jgi:dCMP deaminase
MSYQQFDRYYMDIAKAVQAGAKCLGSKVGAVVVLSNRIVSTGYNGTPNGFLNCDATEAGCVRCHDSHLNKTGRADKMTNSDHVSGKSLDRCICVHAEQNAFLTAARYGIPLEGSVLYSTHAPCFSCLKEAIQVGIARIVYEEPYKMGLDKYLEKQYDDLCRHLCSARTLESFVQLAVAE